MPSIRSFYPDHPAVANLPDCNLWPEATGGILSPEKFIEFRRRRELGRDV